jgi:hypothetical protein
MLQTIQEFGYMLLSVIGFLIILSILPIVLWIIISNYWVYRKGQLLGLVEWHKHTLYKYGYNDAAQSLKILVLSLITFTLCIPSPSDVLSGLCVLLSSFSFLTVAILVAERRRHWEILKASAREVILKSYEQNR